MRGAIGLLANEDRVHRRAGLNPRGSVHHISRRNPLPLVRTRTEADQCLAGVDADAHL